MAKLVLDDIANIDRAVGAINSNSATIEAAFENTLSRDGTTPNQMNADLDMNGNDVLNIGDLVVDGVRLTTLIDDAAIATAAASSATASAAAALVSETNAAASAASAEASANAAAAVTGIPTTVGQDNKVLKVNGTSLGWETQTSDDVTFTPSGTGAVATTVQAALDSLQTWTRVVDVRSLGITGGSDETTEFEALRQDAIANPGTTYVFQDGVEYQYTTPRWLAEVQDATIIAYGASFKNLGATTFGYGDMVPSVSIGSGSLWHDDQGTGQLDPLKANNGSLIDTLAPGATLVTLKTAGETANFAVGDRVLLYYFSRQAASFPPNPGYFQYTRIAAIGVGTLTIVDPANHYYKDTAPDDTVYGATCGKARILNLDRTGYKMAGRIRWYGGSGVAMTGFSGSGAQNATIGVVGAWDVEVHDAPGFMGSVNSFCKNIKYVNCDFTNPLGITGANEMDKVIENLEYRDCSIKDLNQGTGVMNLSINGGSLRGAGSPIRPKNIKLRGVHIHSQVANGANFACDTYPRDLLEADGCTFYPTGTTKYGLQPGNAPTFTPDAVTTTTMTLNAGNANVTMFKRCLDVGQKITVESTSAAAEIFTITDIAYDGSDNITLTGYHNVAVPTAATSLRRLWHTKQCEVRNNKVVNPAFANWREVWEGWRAWLINMDGSAFNKHTRRRSFVLRNGEYLNIEINGYITQIDVYVQKRYTGADVGSYLSLSNQGMGGAYTYCNLNPVSAGHRQLTNLAVGGAQAGDTALVVIPQSKYCETLVLHLRGDAGTGAFTDGDADDLPIIVVEITSQQADPTL